MSSTDPKDDPEELYNIIEELGKGSYGSVYQAIHLPTQREVALKVLKLDVLTDIKELKAEISLLAKINCPQIVKYYGSYIKSRTLWISMEYCDAGSALDMLVQLKKPFREIEIATLVQQVLLGLDYLHTMSPPTIHRDIKSGNILLTSKGQVKLADFGVATQLTDTLAKKNTQIGSPFWMAPEIIQESPYGTKVDIWSLGITAIELAQLKPPHWEHGSIRALFLIATKASPTLDEPSKWSKDFNDFLGKCLQRNSQDRPDASELLGDTFIKMAGNSTVLANLADECFLVEAEGSEKDQDGKISDNHDTMTWKANQHASSKDSVKFLIRGEPKEGVVLTADGESIKEHARNPRFLWFRSPQGEDEFVQVESDQKVPTYVPTKDDIGCVLRCVWLGEVDGQEISVSAITDIIQPGAPQILNLKMEGGPYYTRLFKLNSEYFGGEEGASKIQWSKTLPDGSFYTIPDAQKMAYQPTQEDISCRLEVKYIPIRSDGIQGPPVFVVSRPILRVVGRVLLYVISGLPACLHAKALLVNKAVPFVEIDLLKFPERVEEMERMTGKKSVPQIFFNQNYIGGLKELLNLEISGKLTALLKEVIEREPPDFPKVPTEDEVARAIATYHKDDATSKEDTHLYRTYLKMRNAKKGLPVKVRGPITRRVRAFKGTEMIRWIRVDSKLSIDKSCEVAEKMQKQNYFFVMKADDHKPFASDDRLYQFQTDMNEGIMLNWDQLKQIDPAKRRSPGAIAKDMIRQILYTVEKYGNHGGKKGDDINYSGVGFSTDYRHYVNTCMELQSADLTGLKDDKLKAFFINVYNALVLHASIVSSLNLQGISGTINDYTSWGRLGYVINDQKFTILDIYHGMLRGNKKASRRKIKQVMSKHDPKIAFMTKPDPRIHFALISGSRSFPAVAVYRAKTLDKDLNTVTEAYLDEEVEMEKVKKTVIIPKLFYYYNKDFGKNDSALVKWIIENIPKHKKEEFEHLAKHRMTVKFSSYDWDFYVVHGDSFAQLSASSDAMDNDPDSESGSDSTSGSTDSVGRMTASPSLRKPRP
eukprot:TRINITY_DN3526_c0_g1_i1.p1 TRINITY_DN3526_c0_g1~~TRINITY_DN3526_c0_g1_i1.p1  ORF type:complete len:1045 (-),score=343.24 TRINITY_DN3526_c0_g1_i1:27-3161(-)